MPDRTQTRLKTSFQPAHGNASGEAAVAPGVSGIADNSSGWLDRPALAFECSLSNGDLSASKKSSSHSSFQVRYG